MTVRVQRVAVNDAELEVFVGGSSDPRAPVICAAHPAEAFVPGTVELLGRASGARVVCVNPRGIGGSSAAEPGYGLDAMVEDVERVRRKLDLGSWFFWGMSGGGWLGQIYARKRPQALRGVILESVCPCFRARLADPDCLLSPFHKLWRDKLEEAGLIDQASHDQETPPDETTWLDVARVGSVFRRIDGPALLVSPAPPSRLIARMMPILFGTDARDWLSAIDLPALVIYGTADPLVPVAHARAVHEKIARSKLVAVEGAGHVPTTQGRSEVAEAVRAFVRR